MQRAGKILTLLIAGVLAVLGPSRAFALSLRSSFQEVVLEGLEPGRQYSLKALTRRALEVSNTGTEKVTLEMRSAVPTESQLKDGYEPVPDAAWIRIERPRREVAAGETAESDALVSVPDDAKLRGGRFQAQWLIDGAGPDGARLTLRSRLLLHISPRPAGRAPGTRRRSGPEAVEVRLLPGEGRAAEVPLGRAVDLTAEMRLSVKLANLGPRAVGVRFFKEESLDPARLENGYEPAPNPDFLKLASAELELIPGRVSAVGLTLEIPDETRYRGRRWVFEVEAERPGSESPALRYRLYVTTEKENGKVD